MFGYNPSFVVGSLFGGLVGIWLFSHLFRYALLGRSGTKLQNLWVILLTGIVAIGFSAFGDGTDGFTSRLANPPTIVQALSYSLGALLVGAVYYLGTNGDPSGRTDDIKKSSIVGRAVALVFVIPMILIGAANLAGTTYSFAVYGPPQTTSGLGVSKAEMRGIMLNGDMGPFWHVVNERAPEEMDYVIDRMFTREDEITSLEAGRKVLSEEVINYRVSLATYGPALSDEQRKEILKSTLDFLKVFRDLPSLCVDAAMTGGNGMRQEDLLLAQDELNNTMIIMTKHLLDAKMVASSGASVPTPPTETDYMKLVNQLYAAGMTEDELQSIMVMDAEHPSFCEANILFYEHLIAMKGASGEAVRFEATQAVLTTQ